MRSIVSGRIGSTSYEIVYDNWYYVKLHGTKWVKTYVDSYGVQHMSPIIWQDHSRYFNTKEEAFKWIQNVV